MNASHLFNAELRALRRARAARASQRASQPAPEHAPQRVPEPVPQEAGFLFQEAAGALAERLSYIRRDFQSPILHGNDFGALHAAFPRMRPSDCLEGEREIWPLAAASCDLILSNLQLHWVNDLPGLLIQMRRSLQPDGFFSACLIGGESLFELRVALAEATDAPGLAHSPRISPMIDVPTAAGLVQRAGFALPVVDHEIVNLSYAHPLSLLKDLRAMGQTNALANQKTGVDPRAFWPEVCRTYQALFAHEQGGVRATFDLIFLSGWVPAASQQQPLKPGSAARALREALA